MRMQFDLQAAEVQRRAPRMCVYWYHIPAGAAADAEAAGYFSHELTQIE